MLKMVSPFLPQPASPGQFTGIFDGRKVEFHCGIDALEVVDRVEHDLAGDLQARLVRVRPRLRPPPSRARPPAHLPQ